MKRRDPLLFDRVLIRRLNSSSKKKTEKAGIILPDTIDDKYKSSEGTLVLCGEDCHPDVKALINKPVLFARYSGDETMLNGEEYLLATDKDIFGGISE